MNEKSQFDEQLQKLVDRLLNLEPIPDPPACPKCAVYHEHLDASIEVCNKAHEHNGKLCELVHELSERVNEQSELVIELSERLKELAGKVSEAVSLIEGANAARDLLLDLTERRQQGMPPTLAQVINRAVLAECREIGRTPRLNAESEIEYPVEPLDKILSTWTDHNALHKLCKGALMAMAESL